MIIVKGYIATLQYLEDNKYFEMSSPVMATKLQALNMLMCFIMADIEDGKKLDIENISFQEVEGQ